MRKEHIHKVHQVFFYLQHFDNILCPINIDKLNTLGPLTYLRLR